MSVYNDLEKYISENGEYLIPVTWSVYSTIKVVGADNLKDAFEIAEREIDNIPLDPEPEFIEGSYEIDISTESDLIDAQEYHCWSNIVVHKNGKIDS